MIPNRPKLMSALPSVTEIKPLPEADKTWGARALGVAATLGKGVAQEIAKSYIATAAEISERIMNPMWKEQKPFGTASYTPQTDIEKKIFGTDKPISFKSIGEDVLAIGGEDFLKEWGSFAIPFGMIIAGLDVTPVGLLKKSAIQVASKSIARTDNITTITKAIRPLFKNASDDVIKMVARGLKDVRSEKSIQTILSNMGTIKKGSVVGGVFSPPTIKKGANISLNKFDDYMDGISLGRVDVLENLVKEADKVKSLQKVGKITADDAKKFIQGIHDEIVDVARKTGVDIRMTQGGNIRIFKRKGAKFVTDAFKKADIKDVKPGLGGGTKDITRLLQEADGSLTVAQRAARGVGRVESDILRRTQEIIKMRGEWLFEKQNDLMGLIKGIDKNKAETANRVIVNISSEDKVKPIAKLMKKESIKKITQDPQVVEFAVEARKYFDDLLDVQNYFRAKRGQDLIPKRKFYSPDQIKKDSLWSEAFGVGKDTGVITKPGLPDFISPDKPFVAHALARKANLPEYAKEMNLVELLEKYTNSAAKDIFNTSIIQNNKAHIQVLEDMGKPNLARAIQDWTAEAFAGVRAGLDRKLALDPAIQSGMSWWRNALVKSVFPLNFAWNTFVQTASANLTITRYGVRNSLAAGFEWFTNPKSRKWVEENAYSYIVKTGKSGKITKQDINKGMADAVRLTRKPLDTAVDAANFFTEGVERHLTGWSVLAAKRDGAKRGLRGDALKWFASDGGAKTQSMYNLEDLPGILRSEVVKTAAPFNTFSFEMFNTLREMMGKTGVPPSTQQERIKWILRFFAGATAINYISNAAINRKPWQVNSFIPFYSLLVAPVEARITGDYASVGSTRHLPSPVGIGYEFSDGIYKFATKGETKKLRQTSIKYLPGLWGIPAGTQASRTIDGIIAISDGGVKDSGGRMLFPITEPKDQMRALFSGPWSTSGGAEYWDKRERNFGTLLEEMKQQWFDTENQKPTIKHFERPSHF